ncbi:MAG: hypothetical protein K2X98_00945 [Alphaproteobacteria bacterium]|nr:hypothetical protein [Alphaproteobacteria bacterium]
MKQIVSMALALALTTSFSYAMDDEKDLTPKASSSSKSFSGSIEKLTSVKADALQKEKKAALLKLEQEKQKITSHVSFTAKLPGIIEGLNNAAGTTGAVIEHIGSGREALGDYISQLESNSSKTSNIEKLQGLASHLSEETFGKSGLSLLKGSVGYSSVDGNALLTLKNLGVSAVDIKYHCEIINDSILMKDRKKAGNVSLFVSLDTSGRAKTIFEGRVSDVLAQMAGSNVLTIFNGGVLLSLKEVGLLKDSSDETGDVADHLFKAGVAKQFQFTIQKEIANSLEFPVAEENIEDRNAHLYSLACLPFGTMLQQTATMMNLPGRSPKSFKPVLEAMATMMEQEIENKKKDIESLEARAAEVLEKVDHIMS